MIFLRKPEPYLIRTFLNDQVSESLTYREVGATRGELPVGYSINHTRKRLGIGLTTFDHACDALRNWHQLRLGWVDCWPHDAPLEKGEPVAVLGTAFGVWWLNACRVVYTVDECTDRPRFGYAHGTLPHHVASGEERFLVEMHPNGEVWLDILAFSRPNTKLARLGSFFMRRAQQRFGRDSANRILSVVQEHGEVASPEPLTA